MKQTGLAKIAQAVFKSDNPIATGNKVLLDVYNRTAGPEEKAVRTAAIFELVRSTVIQAAYEAIDHPPRAVEWPDGIALDKERADALHARAAYLEGGMKKAVAARFPDAQNSELNRLRVALDAEANFEERFLGSVRRYAPGVGYAVSIRKRDGFNQDSFLLGQMDGVELFMVADGCGSEAFSSIASHMSIGRTAQMSDAFLRNPKQTICTISNEIAMVLNSQDMRDSSKEGSGGASTLIIGASRRDDRKAFIVGDSIGFLIVAPQGTEPMVEVLKHRNGMRYVMGQQTPLRVEDVDEHARHGGQLVLTSDGVTNFLKSTSGFLLEISRATSDCVLIAERIVRAVLKNQMVENRADDVTVVVQEAKN